MKTAKTVVAVMVGLLSLLAGAAKIAQVPEEVAFLGQFGFGATLIVAFGVLAARVAYDRRPVEAAPDN